MIVSDRVGCAADMVDETCGRVFPWEDFSAMIGAVHELTRDRRRIGEMGRAAGARAWANDIAQTEKSLLGCLLAVPAL